MLAIKWLHSRQGQYEKTGGRRINEGGKGEGSFEKYSTAALSALIPYIFFLPEMVACHLMLLKTPVKREEMLTTECIDFFRSGKLQENKSGCLGIERGRLYKTE